MNVMCKPLIRIMYQTARNVLSTLYFVQVQDLDNILFELFYLKGVVGHYLGEGKVIAHTGRIGEWGYQISHLLD